MAYGRGGGLMDDLALPPNQISRTLTRTKMSIFNNIFQAPVPVEVLKHGLPLLDVGKEPSKLVDIDRPR